MQAITQLLTVSGLAGIAVGLTVEWYRLTTLDPVVGTGSVPGWVEPARFMLIVAALVVLVYAMVVDDLPASIRRPVSGFALLGQWGTPLMLLADSQTDAIASVFGFLALVTGFLFVLAAVLVTVAVGYQFVTVD